MSFRARLVLGAAYLLLAVLVALTVPLALNVDRRARSELESDVVANAAVLSARVSDLVARGNVSGAAPAQVVERLGQIVSGATVADRGRTLVVDGRGRVLADSAATATPGEAYATEERPELGTALSQGRVDVRRRHSETLGEDLLLVTVPVADGGQVVGALRVSAPMGAVDASVRSSWLRVALIGLVVVLVGLGLAWILAGSIARPLEKLGAAAARLGQGDLDSRVEPEGPREMDAVGRSFNRMADALSANLSAQRDFVANASHQLRTPLTGIKLRLEAIQARGGSTAEEAQKAEREVDRLSALVDDLLALARASSVETTGEVVDLGEAARAAARRWAGPAAGAGHELEIEDGSRVRVWAASGDLAQILDNLIENAIRYSPPGTRIVVTAE
ncbi:MAG TPA: histidine kinase dimerization/phospho-acceptor domain-containing protein, partial [Gaiellaceae bacterium]|nr:histidine kinase dimerization/phospho-acceptor domain-containing protein [Gaiellaceae bacterium]